jgi:fibronectin type 3 domain-containing protein
MSAVQSRDSVADISRRYSRNRRFSIAMMVCSVIAGTLAGVLVVSSQPALAGTWYRQTVDAGDSVGQYTSIAIDAAGYPRIGYYDLANGDVKYAKWDGISWHVETVAWYFSVGQFLSMALDSEGLPNFSYYNGSGNSLEYARWDGNEWITTTVDSGGVVGWHTSIALNSSGYPRIAYYDAAKGDLKFAKYNGSGWMKETVDSTGDVGAYASIALNSTDCPRISYFDATKGDLKLATWNGSSWNLELVDSTGYVGKYTSIALGRNDSVHISYYDMGNVHLKYSSLQGGSWKTVTVDTKNFVGLHSSIKIDGGEKARISYYDDSASTLRYARWNGSAWNIELVDGPGVGLFSSMAIDSDGYAHISYYDIAGRHLKYSKGVGNEAPAAPSRPTGPTSVVASRPWAYSTIALDPENDPISYIISWGDASTSQTGNLGPGVPANVSHTWMVRGTFNVKAMAVDVHGMQSWWSDALAVEVFELTSAPWYLAATGGSDQVSLTWNTPPYDGGSPITSYDVFRGLASSHETFLASAGGNVFNDTEVINGMTYYYTVRARTIFGESPDSNEDFATPYAVPGAPTGLRAVAGDSQVMLNWTAPNDVGGAPVTNYIIYRGTVAGGESLLAWTLTVFNYLDTGLANGVAYYYKAKAKNKVGESASSEEASATPLTRPSPPRYLLAVASSHEVNLTWSASAFDGGSPVTNYTILRGDWWNAESPLIEAGNLTSFEDVGLTNGRSYYYAVTAKNAVGSSGWSNQVKATPSALPSQPSNLTAVAGDSEVMLTWLPPADNGGFLITNYSIWRGLTSGQEALLTIVGDTPRYRDDEGVVNGLRYYYMVSATTAFGTGPNSTEASSVPSTVPSEPRNLQATAGDRNVTLTWEAPVSDGGSGITGYALYWGLAPDGEIYRIEPGNFTSYVHADITNGATYFYRVVAKNIRGEGPRSMEASVTPATRPGMPVSLRATAGDRQVTLTWQPPEDKGGLPISGYMVYRGTESNEESPLTAIGNEVFHLDLDLTNGLTYFYKVTAINALGEGPQSNETSSTPCSRPSEPRNLVATAGDREVALSWIAPVSDGGFAISGFVISRGSSPGGESLLTQVGAVVDFLDGGLVNGRTYYYKVRALTPIGQGPDSNEASASPGTVPGRPSWVAADVAYGQVKLTWGAPADDGGFPVTGYSVNRGTAPGAEAILTQLGLVLNYLDAGLDNGVTYYYTIAAVNSLGTGITSYELSGTPRDMPPGCAMWVPTWRMILTGKINITGAASDDSGIVETVEVRIDDGQWAPATGATTWTYEWDTTTSVNGQHSIHVRSYDGHNYSTEVQVIVEVSNTVTPPHQEGYLFSEPWFWATTATIVFGLTAMFVLLAGKRRGKAKEEKESADDLLTLKL